MKDSRPLVVAIVGTRPEAIKLIPVLRALAGRGGIDQQLILTGQHPGLARLFDFLPVEDLAIDPSEQSAGELMESVHYALLRRLARRRASLVLVQGDTTSAAAGALAAHDCGIPVAHVEAGLRSHDLTQPWPEEANRIAIDELASLLFAPTARAAGNLAAEPRVAGEVHVTGNSGIDALFEARVPAPASADGGTASDQPPATSAPSLRAAKRRSNRAGTIRLVVADEISSADPISSIDGDPDAPTEAERRLLLVTCHRSENRPFFPDIAAALKRVVRGLPVRILFLLHPNPRVRRAIVPLLAGEPDIELVAPVDHDEMVRLIGRSWAILTDSGGLTEEGAALGRPVLVLRSLTEREEAIDGANAELVGTDPARIYAALSCLLADREKYDQMAQPSLAFGDGRAAPRIAEAIAHFLERERGSARPGAATPAEGLALQTPQ